MASHFPAVLSHHGMNDIEASENSGEKPEGVGSWFLSRKEIEDSSPSRKNGIDLKKETLLRKSYCTFLQDLGMKLKVPQVTIATAIIFCHRFYLRQSHAKNDRRTIATACMFLAGKVEESPRLLKDVIIVAYEILYKKDPVAAQRIKQKEVYERQKELILSAERFVLATLGFDLNVLQPYKPLVEAIKKFRIAQNTLAQVAWNFVNDGLRTSLCLQFKPHHVAAGAIFLATKFLKVSLPFDGDRVWWQEFGVTPRQLEEMGNQLLELYEQSQAPLNVAERSAGTGVSHHPSLKVLASNEEHLINKTKSCGSKVKDMLSDQKGDGEVVNQQNESSDHRSLSHQEYTGKNSQNNNTSSSEHCEESKESNNGRRETSEAAIKKIDTDKVRAKMEKRKKIRGEIAWKVDVVMGEEDLIERELEEGIELGGTESDRKKSHGVDRDGHKQVVGGSFPSDQEPSSRKRKAVSPAER